ncbi:HesA/MoeB/ThiF family protein [Chlorobium sp. KB01]|uniref:HesA/MoeB/ThiF family protein n=1 Tax=Chlorobium sp. KB01 TaxID=1917528 RepID=UPI000976EFA9|nr:HesA/MoeB/ThiF family protein [Chlorobium sp. KB01]
MPLNDNQRQRYLRHLSLQEIGEAGQEKLLQAKVLVVGAGGLGSPAAFYLAAAGIGSLGIMDGDTVELSNLQRQILHTTASLGEEKVNSAAERINALDPDIRLSLYPFRLTEENAPELLAGYDFVLDATDNFESKFLIAKACHQAAKPYSHAGIRQFYGQMMTVHPGKTACYHCVFHEEGVPAASTPSGPIGALPGIIGSMQAIEAIKYILSIGKPLVNTLLTCDALTSEFRNVPLSRDPHCPLCGTR